MKATNPEDHARNRLLKAIRRHVNAQVGLSWIGSQPPEDHAAIKQEANEASYCLTATIVSMHISESAVYWDLAEGRPRTARERKRYLLEWAKKAPAALLLAPEAKGAL